jgi:isoleucyl-tRNA synthetase
VAGLSEHIQEELNVKDVQVVRDASEIAGANAFAGDERYSVAVATELSDALVSEGFARELVRRLQMMRRSAGLEISDHIAVFYQGTPLIGDVFSTHADYIRQETLSVELRNAAPPEGASIQSLHLDGNAVVLGLTRAG